MANLANALQQLQQERKEAQLQVEKLDSAIAVLQELVGRNSSRIVRTRNQPHRVVFAVQARRFRCTESFYSARSTV